MARSKKTRDNKDFDQIVPKKKWNALCEVRDFLVAANVKVVAFNGYQILTEKHAYGLLDSVLYIIDKSKLPPPVESKRATARPKPPKVEKLVIPKIPKSEILEQMKKRGEKLLKKKTKAAKKGKKK